MKSMKAVIVILVLGLFSFTAFASGGHPPRPSVQFKQGADAFSGSQTGIQGYSDARGRACGCGADSKTWGVSTSTDSSNGRVHQRPGATSTHTDSTGRSTFDAGSWAGGNAGAGTSGYGDSFGGANAWGSQRGTFGSHGRPQRP